MMVAVVGELLALLSTSRASMCDLVWLGVKRQRNSIDTRHTTHRLDWWRCTSDGVLSNGAAIDSRIERDAREKRSRRAKRDSWLDRVNLAAAAGTRWELLARSIRHLQVPTDSAAVV